jgi:hypothetical protein
MEKWKKENRNMHGSKINYYDKMTDDYYKKKNIRRRIGKSRNQYARTLFS